MEASNSVEDCCDATERVKKGCESHRGAWGSKRVFTRSISVLVCLLVISVSVNDIVDTPEMISVVKQDAEELVETNSTSNDTSQQTQRQAEWKPFDPVRDMALLPDHDPQHAYPRYSSFRCVEQSPESPLPQYTARTCVFHDLYFRPADRTFHYFSSQAESGVFGSSEEIKARLETTAGYIHSGVQRDSKKVESMRKRPAAYGMFSPQVHWNESLPSVSSLATVASPKNPVFVLYKPSYSFNFGHFVFDDALSIFTMLDFFGYSEMQPSQEREYQHIPVFLNKEPDPFYRCSRRFRWDMCSKMLKKVMPELMGIQPDLREGFDMLRTSNLFDGIQTIPEGTELIRLPRVIAGTGRLAHFGCTGECTIHRTGRLYRFRQWMFQNMHGNQKGNDVHNRPAKQGRITISLPVDNTHPNDIQNFTSIIPVLQKEFGEENVNAANLAKFSVKEQVDLIASSQVFLSNHGGGSASSLFLQRGSSFLVFHNRGLTRDIDFYNSLGYFYVDWVEVKEDAETVVRLIRRALSRPMH